MSGKLKIRRLKTIHFDIYFDRYFPKDLFQKMIQLLLLIIKKAGTSIFLKKTKMPR